MSFDHVLEVVPRTVGVIAQLANDSWRPVIRTATAPASDRLSFNKAMAENARRFLFGPDCTLVKKYLPAIATRRPALEPAFLGFIFGTHAVVHEFVWHRFVSALHKGISPDMKGEDFAFFFEGLKRSWVPPLMFPVNLPDFVPGLWRNGDVIEAYLYDAPDPMPVITRVPPSEDDALEGSEGG